MRAHSLGFSCSILHIIRALNY